MNNKLILRGQLSLSPSDLKVSNNLPYLYSSHKEWKTLCFTYYSIQDVINTHVHAVGEDDRLYSIVTNRPLLYGRRAICMCTAPSYIIQCTNYTIYFIE